MTAATETPSRGSVSDEEASFALGQLGNFGRLQRGAMPPARAATVTDLALRLPLCIGRRVAACCLLCRVRTS